VVESFFSTLKLELGLDGDGKILHKPPAAEQTNSLLNQQLFKPRAASLNVWLRDSYRPPQAVRH
jgi:hypothetical protein